VAPPVPELVDPELVVPAPLAEEALVREVVAPPTPFVVPVPPVSVATA
jgi:hypothetical protein